MTPESVRIFQHGAGCSPCCKKRGIDESDLLDGATIVGGAKLVEWLANGSPCVTYRAGPFHDGRASVVPAVSFDGGDLDCGDGLLLVIRKHIDPLDRGQLLQILSTERSVVEDLPSWCRLTGNEFVEMWSDGGPQRSFLVSKGPFVAPVDSPPVADQAVAPSDGSAAQPEVRRHTDGRRNSAPASTSCPTASSDATTTRRSWAVYSTAAS